MPPWLVALFLVAPVLLFWYRAHQYQRKLRIDLEEFLKLNQPLLVKLWWR